MANTFSVAISYKNALGWIGYDADARKAIINLDQPEGKKLVEDYLAASHEINVPHETLMDHTEMTVDPLADIKRFQTSLTRLWNATQVHVDWSRPIDYVKAHPHY